MKDSIQSFRCSLATDYKERETGACQVAKDHSEFEINASRKRAKKGMKDNGEINRESLANKKSSSNH